MSEEIRRTAFDRPQRAMGVVQHLDREGWYRPKHFGDPVAEHRAIRNDVGVWDASPLRKLAFSGPDAVKAVDRIFTNDMLSLEVGQVRYTPFCDEKGKMVGECTVFKTADDGFLAVTALDSDLDHFRVVAEGLTVEIEPMTRSLPQLGITGPRSRETRGRLLVARADRPGVTSRRWPSRCPPAAARSTPLRRTTQNDPNSSSKAPERDRTFAHGLPIHSILPSPATKALDIPSRSGV